MGLPYKKLTEEEDQMRNVLEKGEYPFCVKAIKRGMTKSGTYEMLTVDLSVVGMDGREVKVTDWIVFMDNMAWKFRHFAATCGLMDRYEDGTIELNHFLGKNGVVKLSVRDYEQGGEQRKGNAVADYIKPGFAKGNPSATATPVNNNDFIDDDIPL